MRAINDQLPLRLGARIVAKPPAPEPKPAGVQWVDPQLAVIASDYRHPAAPPNDWLDRNAVWPTPEVTLPPKVFVTRCSSSGAPLPPKVFVLTKVFLVNDDDGDDGIVDGTELGWKRWRVNNFVVLRRLGGCRLPGELVGIVEPGGTFFHPASNVMVKNAMKRHGSQVLKPIW